ncbi:MAG: hypothetical protein OS112_04820 [Methanoregula sp.]|nr:MAG: hypothetical protein OS112_04820 [Methanoregula sp.]
MTDPNFQEKRQFFRVHDLPPNPPEIVPAKGAISAHFREYFESKSDKRTTIIAYFKNHVPEFAVLCNQIGKDLPFCPAGERRLPSEKEIYDPVGKAELVLMLILTVELVRVVRHRAGLYPKSTSVPVRDKPHPEGKKRGSLHSGNLFHYPPGDRARNY